MALENRGNNYGVTAHTINGNVEVYPTIEQKRKLHSILPKLIEIISNKIIAIDEPIGDCIPESFKIEDKIRHNDLKKYCTIVSDYGNYYSIFKEAFSALDNERLYSKERVLASILEKYKEEKRILINSTKVSTESDMEIIRKNSDNIIDKIKYIVKEEIMLNCNDEGITTEDIDIGLPVFLCYAFVECKILERP